MPDLDSLAPQFAGELTPLQQRQAAQTQALAKVLGARSAIGDSSPVPNVTAGIARVLQAGIEGWGARQDAERAEAQRRQAMADFLRIGAGGQGAIPAGFSLTNDGAKKSADASGVSGAPITAASNDLDQAARTIVSEAGNQGPTGMAAVAGVIKNRASLTGTTPTQVVNAPGQFEAVTNGAAARIDPSSPRYQQALQVAQGVFSGQTPDPTNGATHYYAPTLQSALGRNAPKWDDGSGVKIGDHLFFSRPQDFKRRTADAGDDAAPQPESPTAPAPTQTAQADLPMTGSTPVIYNALGDYTPDDAQPGFAIPGTNTVVPISSPASTSDSGPGADDSGSILPGIPNASTIASAAPAPMPSIRDALANAASTVAGADTSSSGSGNGSEPDLGFFAPQPTQGTSSVAGPPAPPPITDLSPAAPSGAILRPLPLGLNSALPANLAPAPADAAANPVALATGDTAQPIVPLPPARPAGLPGPGDVTPSADWRTATDAPVPLPPVRPAGLAGSGDVAPAADWRTATAALGQDARAAGKVADATGSVVPTQAQRLASVLMPDSSNSNDGGAGIFARSDGGSNTQALAAMLSNSRAGQGGTSGNPDAQALGAVLAGQPIPTAASAAPASAPSGPAPGSVMSPTPSSTVTSAPLPAPAAAPASWASYKPDNTADPAVAVPGYDGRTWTRQQAQQAFNAKADEYPEPSEILAAQRAAPSGGPATTGSTPTSPAPQPGAQPRGPDSATPPGAPGYTPRALQALSVMANENAPAALRQAAQQIFSSEMASNKGQVIYRDGTPYWLKGDGSAPTKFEPDTKYKTWVDPSSGKTYQYDEDDPKNTMTELKAPSGANSPALRPLLDPNERAAHGIDPADKRQALLHPNGDVTYPGSGGISQQVNVGAQKGYAEDLAGALSAQHVALANGANTAGERLAAIHGLQAALERIDKAGGTTGVGTSTITDLKSAANRFANAVGLDPIAGDTSDAETIRKDAMALVGQDAKSNVGTRVTNFDLSTFIKANAGLETSPTANKRILGIKEQLVLREADLGGQIQDATAAALQNGGKGPDPVAINKLIRAYDEKNHIVDPITGQDLTKSVVLPEFKGGGSTTAAAGGGTTTGTPRQPVATITIAPPPQAVQALRANPALRDQFDGKYGQGAASAILGR